jgi:hypothetical protein
MDENLKIGEKWSALFHHTLQAEKSVTPAVAEEALILIRWAFDKYQTYCADHKYEIPSDLVAKKDEICNALSRKAKGIEIAAGDWPVTALKKWESQQPFHEALGSRNLKSGWDSFFKVAKPRYGIME